MSISPVVLFSVIVCCGTWTMAQSLDYGAYGLFPQGSTRAMGIGGAYTAVSDDVTGMIFNPAGLAFGEWAVDIGGTNNSIDNREVEVSPGVFFGVPYSFTFYAAAFRLGTWAIGLGYSQPYNATQESFGLNKRLTVTNGEIVLAKSFFKNLSLGVAAHYEEVEEFYKDDFNNVQENEKVSGQYYSYGLAFRHKKFGFGASYYPRREYEVDKTKNASLPFGEIWFRDISIAAKTSIGISYWAKPDLLIVADMDTFEAIPNTMVVGTGSFSDLSAELIKPQKLSVLHGGIEWYMIRSNSNEVIWRLGGYKEPSRLIGGTDRAHFTMGLEVRFGPAILSVAFDNAENFKNTSAGFSLSFGKI